MARTDWTMSEIVKPEDFNKIGTELNEARSTANAAETPAGAQSKVDVALEDAKEYTDAAISGIPAPPVTSVNSKMGAVTLGKSDIGLGNVENVKQASKMEFDTHTDATTAHGATSDATPNRIVTRDANGQFKVGAPTDAAHVARKGDIPVFATKAQAEAGTATNVIMSPERTKQAIEKLSPQPDVIWRINTSNNLPEWSNDNGGSWNSVSANGILIASDNYQEGDPTERMLSLSSAGNQSLVYKFIPTFTGEIKIKADVKRIQGGYGIEFNVVAPTRRTTSRYVSSVGVAEGLIYSVPVGSVVNIDLLNTSSYSLTRLGTTANNTNVYVSMTGTIFVFENVPVYLTTHSQENGSGAIKNIEICYDIIYK